MCQNTYQAEWDDNSTTTFLNFARQESERQMMMK